MPSSDANCNSYTVSSKMRSLKARLRSVKLRFGSKVQIDEEPSPLCSECNAIFDNWCERDEWSSIRPGHSHHHIVGLIASSKNGCLVCAMLLQRLPHAAVEELLQDQPSLKSFVTVKNPTYAGYSQFYLITNTFHFQSMNKEHDLKTEIEAYPSEVGTSTKFGKIQDSADAEENWALVKKWLSVCQNTHTKCFQKSLSPELPTRLIDVGDTDEDLKLCQSNSLSREIRYLTLSHCWGGKVFTTLTSANFQEFLSHIPTDSLSKTFREAILTTRKLGFKYIWIDSLCIIQGDEVDWRKEASQMSMVYSNSALNIAATAAPDGDFGCFSTRTPGQVYGCKVATRDGRESLDTSVWDITVKDMTLQFMGNVLSSRAWVFQEYFLAPRALHFTSQQLLWECISGRACETFPDSYDDGSLTIPASKITLWNNPTNTLSEKWSSIVHGYSGKNMTFRKDKLVAVSGIARIFAQKFGTTYLAGMWKEDLIIQLSWLAFEPSSADIRSSMPSWSWAAVDERVFTHDDDNFKERISLVSIFEATTIAVDDAFGDIREGKIRMRCPLPFIATIVEQHYLRKFRVRLHSRTFILSLYPDRTQYSAGQELYCLPLLRGLEFDKELLCGVIIERVEPGSYRRSGYFDTGEDDDEYGIQGALEAQQKASYEDKYFIGEALGHDEHGQKMCIITLV